jgi:hypothetical protein
MNQAIRDTVYKVLGVSGSNYREGISCDLMYEVDSQLIDRARVLLHKVLNLRAQYNVLFATKCRRQMLIDWVRLWKLLVIGALWIPVLRK